MGKDTQPKLTALKNVLSKSLDTVDSRQNHLNKNLESTLSELESAQEQLSSKEQRLQDSSSTLENSRQNLESIENNLSLTYKEIENRSTSHTDSMPVVKLKGSLNKLVQEIKDMNLLNAVLEHQLTQIRMHK